MSKPPEQDLAPGVVAAMDAAELGPVTPHDFAVAVAVRMLVDGSGSGNDRGSVRCYHCNRAMTLNAVQTEGGSAADGITVFVTRNCDC